MNHPERFDEYGDPIMCEQCASTPATHEHVTEADTKNETWYSLCHRCFKVAAKTFCGR